MQAPLEIQGVGNGTQRCEWEAVLLITLQSKDGSYAEDRFTAPVIPDSAVPGLLGLKSMINKRAIVDTVNKRLIFCGPGPVEIKPPPGSDVYQMEQAPSGHLLLPISDYESLKRFQATRDRLQAAPEPMSLPVMEGSSASSSSNGQRGLPRRSD